jgi:hypothetical protein
LIIPHTSVLLHALQAASAGSAQRSVVKESILVPT